MEQKRLCLVVEDDDDIRGLVAVVLSAAGFDVMAVGSGAAGIAAAANPAIALVTLDLGLPDMDGHEVARAIRGLTSAPLLFLTARSEEDDILAGMASGAAAYLTKPFRPRELRELAGHLADRPPLSQPPLSQAPHSQEPHIPGKSPH
ncbi:MAG: response regulator transcription factor [Actinomycetes bacterium]